METQKVRLAVIRGKILKKRCRKEVMKYFQGVGLTDEEALSSLKNEIEKEKSNWKSFEFPTEAKVYDGIRNIYLTHNTIMQPVYPTEKDNLKMITVN